MNNTLPYIKSELSITLKVYIPSNRFYINDGFDDNRKCVFVFKDEDTDTDNA